MSFIPDEELKEKGGLSLAPMIDFLFLLLAVFAALAVSRNVIKDTTIDLVKSDADVESEIHGVCNYKLIHITISADGSYKWVTEIRDYPMPSVEAIVQELLHQHQQGLIPEEKLKTQVFLKIDRKAEWEPILQAVLAIQEAGFEVRPLYEPME